MVRKFAFDSSGYLLPSLEVDQVEEIGGQIDAAKLSLRECARVRLPDKEGKYRDELTQEAEIGLDETGNLEEQRIAVETKARELRASFYAEATRLGGCDYQETTP